MSITQTRPDRKKNLDHAPQEFGPVALELLTGQIPAGLSGTLYRNGPARFERGGRQVSHLFDGDGAVLRVQFESQVAVGSYRYVRTAGYLEEEKAGQLLYAGFGSQPPGGLLKRFSKGIKHPANTSVLAFEQVLLALWEGGAPYALDPLTLATRGLDDLGGLKARQTFSAHPVRDPLSGEVYNFGASYGKDFGLDLYRCDGQTGRILQQKHLHLPGMGLPLVHDFVMAGPYLVFLLSPVVVNPFWLLTRLKTLSQSLEWKPGQGTRLLVVDRQSLEIVSQGEAESWYQWHYGNACLQPDGSLCLDLVAYQDFETNRSLGVRTGETAPAPAPGYLTRLRLDPARGRLLEKSQLMNLPGEFPVVRPQDKGQPWNRTWLVLADTRPTAPDVLARALACYDHRSDTYQVFEPEPHCSVSEALYAQDPDRPDQGWLLCLAYDARQQRSEVWILDSGALEEGPICKLALPGRVPLTFHGVWQART